MARNCDRCRFTLPASDAYGTLDYCGKCAKNLCPECMEAGCCGQVPAESGMEADCSERCAHRGCKATIEALTHAVVKTYQHSGHKFYTWYCSDHAPAEAEKMGD